jgi:tetratricopeptide (TPR) repeat protein
MTLRFRTFSLAISLLLFFAASPAPAQQISLSAWMQGGHNQYSIGNYKGAKERYAKALAQYGQTASDKDLANIHLWLGLCDGQLNFQDSAAPHFATAMDKDTSLIAKVRAREEWAYFAWTSLFGAARGAYGAQDNENALRFALAALKLDPSKSQTHQLIATIYRALERFEDMKGVALDLLKMDKSSPEAFSLLGLYFLNKPDTLWPPELRLARWDSSAHYYSQATASYLDRFNRAEDSLRAVLKLSDKGKATEIAWKLVEKSRSGGPEELKRYIEKDLAAPKLLNAVAVVANQLFVAANNLNVASSNAGNAMLRASAETRGDTATRFRARAETLFARAVEFDSSDFTSLFDLGITQYQGQNDSAAEMSLAKVIAGTVVPLSTLPSPWLDSLVGLVSAESAPLGYVQIAGVLVARVDSVLSAQGKRGSGHEWLYFPAIKSRQPSTPASLADTTGMFLSTEQPRLLEQTFLWLGSAQTGLASALQNAKREGYEAKFRLAIGNLLVASQLDPTNAEAFQNLGFCYTGIKQTEKALAAFATAKKLREPGH